MFDLVCQLVVPIGHCQRCPDGVLAVVQGTNPIYNLLPDILSSLSAEPGLPSAHFQVSRHFHHELIKTSLAGHRTCPRT